MTRADRLGVSVKATTSDIAMANAIVTPKPFINRPDIPDMNATGRNTAMSEKVVASTARPISRVAAMAAGKGFIPFSFTNRKMFSRTTIASSITIPTASARANSVIMLRVNPCHHMSAKVPMIDTGIASAATSALRKLARNSSTTREAKRLPSTRCSFTLETLVRTTPDSSRITSSV